jgi:hypothetical protein
MEGHEVVIQRTRTTARHRRLQQPLLLDDLVTKGESKPSAQPLLLSSLMPEAEHRLVVEPQPVPLRR